MKLIQVRGCGNHRPPTLYQVITPQTVNSLEPVSLVISAHSLEPAAPGLTNQSLQWTWFLSFTTETFPNAPKKKKKKVQTIPHNHPQSLSEPCSCFGIQPSINRHVLPTGYLHSRICFKRMSMARAPAKAGLQ